MKVIKWAYRHGSLGGEQFDTLDQAVAAASWSSDAGEEALEFFEVFDDDEYRLIDKDEAYDLMRAHSDRQYKAWLERTKDEPKATHVIDVKGPDGNWACWSNAASAEQALTEAVELKAMLGNERVSVRPVGTRLSR